MRINLIEQDLLFSAIAVVGLFSIVNGLKTGRASNFIPGGFKRSEHPVFYWVAIITSGGIVVASLFVVISSMCNR
jgi:hypothetical protein